MRFGIVGYNENQATIELLQTIINWWDEWMQSPYPTEIEDPPIEKIRQFLEVLNLDRSDYALNISISTTPIFFTSIEWVQHEAEQRINRRLTDDELASVKDAIEWGLLFDIDTIFDAAITNAVR